MPWEWIAVVLGLLAAMLAWMLQTSPRDAVSNIYKWVKAFGFNPPEILKPANADKAAQASAIVVCVLVAICLLGSYFWGPGADIDGGKISISDIERLKTARAQDPGACFMCSASCSPMKIDTSPIGPDFSDYCFRAGCCTPEAQAQATKRAEGVGLVSPLPKSKKPPKSKRSSRP
ncbi:MAG: hypothetical protein PHU21_12870 [Elusimicrobia bacterium]|nr:hypothetical protein [Elusimicrobiota bacterium]